MLAGRHRQEKIISLSWCDIIKPMKRAFIIHGWTGKPNEHWTPSLAEGLKEQGFEVHQPEMPETNAPRMEAWVSYLKQQVGSADKDTYFVGHSIGCLAILRYLETYKEMIGGAVLVAPWITLTPSSFSAPEDAAVVREWTTKPFDWALLKTLCPHFVALFSEDDPDVPFNENKPVFEKELGAKIIVFKDKGHFTASAGATDLPEILDEIEAMATL